jgi:hypothetical protein
MNKQNISDKTIYCLIYKKRITEGLCIDINNERLGFFKTGQIQAIKKMYFLSKEDINKICKKCPYIPFD